MINLRHLRAFVAVAEELHFTKAAEACFVSQPALSALIKQLEEWVGVQLIHRNTRQVELTQAGREYHMAVSQTLRELDQASHDLQMYKTIKRGKVSVAALPSLCSSALPELLRRYHREFPDIRLDVRDMPGDRIMDALVSRQVDIACTYAQRVPEVEGERFMSDSLALLCPGDSLLAKRKSVKWKELENHPLVLMEEGTTVRTLIDGVAVSRDLHFKVVLEPKMIAAAVAYVRAGLGVAVLPTAGMPQHDMGGLAQVDLIDPVIRREISVLSLREYTLSPAADQLRQMILSLRGV